MGLLPARQACARLPALPVRAAMVYHDSTAPGTAVPALIRPNLTWPSPPRSVQVRTDRPDDAGPAMTFRNTLRTRWTTRLAASLALWLYGSTAGAAASE